MASDLSRRESDASGCRSYNLGSSFQDAFLDGADFPTQREPGTRELDNLAAELRRASTLNR